MHVVLEGCAFHGILTCRPCIGELGVQAPVGFWDPLGLSADGDAPSSGPMEAATTGLPSEPNMA